MEPSYYGGSAARIARALKLPARFLAVATQLAANSTTVLSALSVVLLSTASTTAFAQATTGGVSGRVLDANTGRYLNNARVTVEGSDIATFTNEYGNFQLSGLPAGEVTLVAFYTGLGEQRATVTVSPGQ